MSVGASEARVVCTLGMHRSGTSLVSRMLNLLGVHLGPGEAVSRTGRDNPKGYWEHEGFVGLNDEILARFGGQWDEPPAFPPSWPRDPRVGDLREKARHLLAEDFAAEPLWGWKDPRTCLTLPFWQDLIGPMRYLMCVRNPCAVVASLTDRNGMSSEKAERLWLTHVQASLAHTQGQPRMLVFYEDVIDDWRPELRRLAAFIGAPERADDPRVHEAVGGFLESEMCHHRPAMEDLVGDPAISLATKGLYLDLALRGHASPRSLPGAPSRERGDPTATIAALRAERDGLVAASRALGERAVALSARCNELALRERRSLQSIASLESALRAMTLDRDGRAREGAAARQALLEIHSSCAGRLVMFARGVIVDVLPPGTRRREVFNAILRRIARRLPSRRGPRPAVDPRTA